MKIIGNKSKIAIEYKVKDKKQFIGYSKIWLSNNFIGTIEDLIFFKGYLFNGLDYLVNCDEIDSCLFNVFNNYDLKKIYYYFKRNLNNDNAELNSYKYKNSLGTFTDDFLIFSFKYEEYIYIIWKITNTKSNFNDIKIAKKNINVFKITKDELVEKTELFKKLIINDML
ncbi:hypothetical protein FLBR109950_15810 [Flavobacterium branchiophilum]